MFSYHPGRQRQSLSQTGYCLMGRRADLAGRACHAEAAETVKRRWGGAGRAGRERWPHVKSGQAFLLR